jgi:hypothetical protein
MLCFPLDIHKMLGVVYVSTWLFQGLCPSLSEGPLPPKTEAAEVTAAVGNLGPKKLIESSFRLAGFAVG